MIEITISQSVNGYMIRKIDYSKPSQGPYGEAYVAKDVSETIKLVEGLLITKAKDAL